MGDLLKIIKLSRGSWKWMLAGIALSTAVITLNSLLMAISGWFIASMAVAGASQLSFNYFFPSATIRALAISRSVGRYFERLITHSVTLRLIATLRVWLLNRFLPLAPATLETYASGELSARLSRDIDGLENLYLRVGAPIVAGYISIIASTLFVSIWSGSAALTLLFFLLLNGLLLPVVAKRIATVEGRQLTTVSADLRRIVADGVAAGDELLLLGAVPTSAALVNGRSRDLVNAQRSLAWKNGAVTAGALVVASIGSAALLLVCTNNLRGGTISGPNLVMLILFSAAAFEACGGISAAMVLYPSVAESLKRVLEIAGSRVIPHEPLQPVTLPVDFTIEFNAVSYSYGGSASDLNSLSFRLADGARLALQGASGSGKSTAVQLLLRFREIQGGTITVGGIDIRSFDSDNYRQSVSAMLQGSHIFNRSIRENILMGRGDATEEELAALLHDCCLHEFIASLPDGLDTMAGEGGRDLSGGEARRVALARCLLKEARLYILDEPTEGLDAATEERLLARLDRRLTGKSLLVITHRTAPLGIVDTVVPV